jgi:hypothetical protein
MVGHFKEQMAPTILAKGGLGKFKPFEGETYVQGASDELLDEQPELPEVDYDH